MESAEAERLFKKVKKLSFQKPKNVKKKKHMFFIAFPDLTSKRPCQMTKNETNIGIIFGIKTFEHLEVQTLQQTS